jgi:hypothetical protein
MREGCLRSASGGVAFSKRCIVPSAPSSGVELSGDLPWAVDGPLMSDCQVVALR